jgi:Phosphoesterase family
MTRAGLAGHRVIVFLQENKTTDFYFPTMAAWGAAVANHGGLLSAPPNFDQPHDRNAWVHWAMGDYPALAVQIDNDAVIPFYSWLAKQFVFADHHFGVGSNSTSGHMLAVGGQTPTMKNPPFVGAHPVWDLPSIFTVADTAGVSWAAFPDSSGYPTKFYTSLTTAPGSSNVHRPAEFIPMAKAGSLPQICYVWSPAGYDEHPPATSNPGYVTDGQNLVWQRVQAVIDGGGWPDTTFILTWDDWGGYADSVPTPAIETVPDALHPNGFPAIGGSRIPLIMFGGKVGHGIDAQWHSHASIPKTIIDLLGLAPMNVPRVDQAPSLASHVDATLARPLPLAYGSVITQPAPPTPTPTPVMPAPWPGPTGQRMPALVTIDGSVLPAPTDGVVHQAPPKPPAPTPTPTPIPVPAPAPGPDPGAGPGPGRNLDDLVDKKYAGTTASELAAAPLDALNGVTASQAKTLAEAFGVHTVAELAHHKLVQAALAIAGVATG